MASVAALLLIAGVVWLMIDGTWCLLDRRRPAVLGVLDWLAAGTLAWALPAVSGGSLVLASELSAVMVRSGAPGDELRLALVAVAVAPALWWYGWSGRRSTLWVTLAVGVAVGVWAAVQVVAVDPGDPEVLRVCRYAVWWPPLVVWLTVSLTGSLFAIGRWRLSGWLRAATTAALVGVLAAAILRFDDLANSALHETWVALRTAGVAAALALAAAALFLHRRRRGMPPEPAGLAAEGRAPDGTATEPPQRPQGAQRPEGGLAGGRFGEAGRQAALAAMVLVPVALLLALDLFTLGLLPPEADALLLLAAWCWLAERLGRRTPVAWPAMARARLQARRQGRQAEKAEKTPLSWTLAVKAVVYPVAVVICLAVVSEALDYRPLVVQSFEWIGAKDAKETVAGELTGGLVNALGHLREELRTDLVKATRQSSGEHPSASGLRALQAGAEVHTLDAAAAKSGDLKIANVEIPLGAFVSPIQRIVRSLLGVRVISGTVTRSGDRYTVRVSASDGQSWHCFFRAREPGGNGLPSTGQGGAPAAVSAGGVAAPDAAPEVECSSDLVPGARRVVGGAAGAGDAAASVGLPLPLAAQPPQPQPQPQPAQLALALAAQQPPLAVQPLSAPPQQPPASRSAARDPLDEMVDNLAFEVASTDPSFIGAGMTRDWIAFQWFRQGLARWQAFDARQGEAALQDAIAAFRAALGRDRRFTMAAYRLGTALLAAGRPQAAVTAFRQGAETNPDFTPGALAEAAALYDFNDYYETPALLDRLRADWPRREQALRTWSGLLALPPGRLSVAERRTAYLGVCRYEMDRTQDAAGSDGSHASMAYYFCRHAAALFPQLSAAERQDAEEKGKQAAALEYIGYAVEARNSRRLPMPGAIGRQNPYRRAATGQLWSCDPAAIDPDELAADGSVANLYALGTRRSRAALAYYRRSIELAPDEREVQCAAASAATYVERDVRPMEALRNDPKSHDTLAQALWEDGFDEAQAVPPAALPATPATPAIAATPAAPAPPPIKAAARTTRFAPASSPAQAGDGPEAVEHERIAAIGYYRRALFEYRDAVRLDPGDQEGLLGVAVMFWQARLDHAVGRILDSVALSTGLEAEADARTALKLAQLRQRDEEVASAGESLGEVLIAQGRFADAARQLEETLARYDAIRPHWPYVNEARWELAQASVCAAAGETAAAEARRLTAQAASQLDMLRAHDEAVVAVGERAEFAGDPSALDMATLERHCGGLSAQSFAQGSRLALSGTQYAAGPACGSATLRVVLGSGAAALPGAAVAAHVWGNGLDTRLSVDGSATRLPAAGPGPVFVQLEARANDANGANEVNGASAANGASGEAGAGGGGGASGGLAANGGIGGGAVRRAPLSPIESFRAYGAQGGDCARNQVTLVFSEPPH